LAFAAAKPGPATAGETRTIGGGYLHELSALAAKYAAANGSFEKIAVLLEIRRSLNRSSGEQVLFAANNGDSVRLSTPRGKNAARL